MKYSLTAALIVKNAEDTITRAIESLLPFVGEIVVVDTGSSDATPRICSRLGAEVYYYRWRDDFSAARNYSLSMSGGEWVIILDADEELDAESFQNNQHLFQNEKIEGINVIIHNMLGNEADEGRTTHRYTRIFRNRSGVKFSGRIHEQVVESIEGEIVESDITIRHYGYIDNPAHKSRRNIDLLRRELDDNPGDPWIIYHLADSEFSGGNFETAGELFGKVCDDKDLTPTQREFARIRLAQIALRQDRFDDVIEWLDFRSHDADREGFRRYVKAAALLNMGRFADALRMYESEETRSSTLINRNQLEDAINIARKAARSV